jgi:TRAP-type C4-dicarboxylate transport system permease small subunit
VPLMEKKSLGVTWSQKVDKNRTEIIHGYIEQFSGMICAFFLLILVCLLTLSVGLRDLLHLSLPWIEEVSTLTCIYMVAFASIYAWCRKTHISVDILLRKINSKYKIYIRIINAVLEMVFLVLAGYGCYEMIGKSFYNKTTVLAISLSYYYAGIFLCFSGMLAVSVFHVFMKK